MTKFVKMAIFLILFSIIVTETKMIYKKEGPRGMPFNKTTSCAEFGKNARFNPYSIVGDVWFVFYYWAAIKPSMIYKFKVPGKLDRSYLHLFLDHHVKQNFDWTAPMLLMMDQVDNHTSLMVQKGDRGQFWIYMLQRGMPLGQLAQRHEVRFKQTSDNKYIGAMVCKTRTAFVMSRIKEIPPKSRLQDEASKLGYVGRHGKSYLYQGHEWMPIPEADEEAYWDIRNGMKPNMEAIYQ